MSEEIRLSSKELKILSAFDKGKSSEEIAEQVEMTVAEVNEILEEAQKKRQQLVSESESSEVSFVYYRTIDATLNVPQRGSMKVGSQILKLLSEGTYSSPANSIKELISNSFDADATDVDISFDGNELIIKDNGKGMDYKDFDEEFVYISRSRKRDKGDFTEKFNRPIIGFIGIGFIAVSELCNLITITSTKKESDLVFKAKIDFSISREREAAEKEFYEVSQFELTNYKKVDKGYDLDEHFTEIRLKDLRPLFKEMLIDKEPFGSSSVTISKLLDHLEEKGNKTFSYLGEYWQFLIELAYISPVTYLADGPIKAVPEGSEEFQLIKKIKSTLSNYNFKVTFDGIELKKPLRFPMRKDPIIYELNYKVHPFKESKVVDGKTLSFEGYIYSQHGSISPKEYNGIITRIRNVSIGNPDTTLLGYPLTSNLVFRNWLFGEIYVTAGLEDAMTIDRSSFKFTHSHYQYLQEFIHNFLEREVFEYTLHDYYYAKKERKKKKTAEKQEKLLTQIIKKEVGETFDLELSSDKDQMPVVVDNKRQKVIINRNHSTFKQVKAHERPLIERLVMLIEISIEKSGGDMGKMRDLLLKLVRKWF
ncbi:ATP-binding protein [Candidatus Bathyarchaeota archaeon]|nr:ATP-binding protein [Candidatus Bathyarchaeota archaeon]